MEPGSENREYAKEILIYYFELVYNKVGLNWDKENEKEINQAIDAICDDRGG